MSPKAIQIKYPSDTAGRKKINNVPVALSEDRILDVKNMLFEKMEELETINYIYVIDEEKRLVGAFSIKDIFLRPEETKVKDIMDKIVVKARPHTDQERVALLALKYNLKAVPVVDKENKFLGVVPSDTILDILYKEDIEDILRIAGIHPSRKVIRGPVGLLTRARLPWLFLGLLGGLLAAQVVSVFENSLSDKIFLVFFIPLILYMGAAVGTQTQTLFIRSLALDAGLPFKKYILREIKIGFLLSVVLAIFLSIISYFWKGLPSIGLILGISLFLTVNAAIFIGLFIPWILYKFKKDPALGAGPFGTIITDITSLVIYFSVSSFLLRFL